MKKLIFFCLSCVSLISCTSSLTKNNQAPRGIASDQALATRGEYVVFSPYEVFGGQVAEAYNMWGMRLRQFAIDADSIVNSGGKLQCPKLMRGKWGTSWVVGTFQLSFTNDLGSEVSIEDQFKENAGDDPGTSDILKISVRDSAGKVKVQTFSHNGPSIQNHPTYASVGDAWKHIRFVMDGKDDRDQIFLYGVRQNVINHLMFGKCLESEKR